MESVLLGYKNGRPEKVRYEAKLTPPGSTEVKEIILGNDGKEYFLIDPNKKIAYVDFDPSVVGGAGRMVGGLTMLEYVHDEPFSDEINGEKKELKGSKKVGSEDTYHVYVKYSQAGQEADWYISKKDFLPRRVDRKFTPQGGGEAGGRQLIVTSLTVAPMFEKDPFKLELPEGYTKSDDFADAPLVSAPEIKEKKEPKPSGTNKQLYTSVELVGSFLRHLPSDASPGVSGWNEWSLDKANAWLETNVVGKRWSMRIMSVKGDFQRISGQGLTYEGMCSIEPGRVNIGGRPFEIMISPGFPYGNILPIETSETEFVDAFRDGGKIVREEFGGIPIVLAATIQGVEISQQERSGSPIRGQIVIVISDFVVSLPDRLETMTSEAAEHAKQELQKIAEGVKPVYPYFSDSIADGIELCGIKFTRCPHNSVTPNLSGIWALFQRYNQKLWIAF